MSNKVKSIQYNFIMNFLLTATNFLFPLITFPYITRVLLSAGTGVVSFASSVTNYFILFAGLGIPTYGIRACARVRDDKEELTKVAHEIFIINSVMTLLCIIAFVFSIYLVPRFREEKALFYVNGISLVLNVFGIQWLYQALEQYDYITIRSIAAKVISVILMFALVHQASDYVIYSAIGVLASAGSNVLNIIRARKFVSFRPVSQYHFRRHFGPILTLFAQTMVISVYTNLDTVMLGFMKGNDAVGLYTTAVKIKTILLTLVSSLGAVLLPRMSHIIKQGDYFQFKSLTRKSLEVTMLMAVPLSAYFCLYAKDCILLLAGDGFLGAVSTMQILVMAVIPIGITSVLGMQVLTSMEKEKCVLYSVIVGAVTDFVLNLVLIPKLSADGAAIATLIAELLVLLIQIYYTREIMGNMMTKSRVPFYVCATVVGTGVSLLVIRFVTSGRPFLRLCISAMMFFAAYGIVLLLGKEPLLMQYLNKIFEVLKRENGTKGEKL